MPGQIAMVLAWHHPDGWELHVHGLGRVAAATIAQFLLVPYCGITHSGTGSVLVHPGQCLDLQPDVNSLHILRVLKQPLHQIGGLVGLHRRDWHIRWQVVCRSGLLDSCLLVAVTDSCSTQPFSPLCSSLSPQHVGGDEWSQ